LTFSFPPSFLHAIVPSSWQCADQVFCRAFHMRTTNLLNSILFFVFHTYRWCKSSMKCLFQALHAVIQANADVIQNRARGYTENGSRQEAAQ
jgi:hypothetical protein